MRNRKLELEYVCPGRWKTIDGRFVILKKIAPINPMEVTEKWKIRNEYSIRNMVGYDGPFDFPEFAPEVGVVDVYREVFPWLGKYTGEGSFEVGNPDRVKPKGLSESDDGWRLDIEIVFSLKEELLG